MANISVFTAKILKKANHFFGLHSYNPQFKKHFDTTNSRAAVVASLIVIALELYMIGYVFFNLLTGKRVFPPNWVALHLPMYFVLLLSAVFLLVFSIKYLKGEKVNRVGGIQSSPFSRFSALCSAYTFPRLTGRKAVRFSPLSPCRFS